VLVSMPFREGEAVRAGDIVARLENQQLQISAERAADGVSRAGAALELARARLYEGRQSVESRMIGIDKKTLELQQYHREFDEAERKQAGQEKVYEAGGASEESIRAGRFALETARNNLELLGKDLAMSRIGLRDQDLVARGLIVPADERERSRMFESIATATVRAEFAAAVANVDAAKKEMKSSALALSELAVPALFDGIVGARFLEEGERAKREDKLLTIIDIRSLYAVAAIHEADAYRLSVGMKARVLVDASGVSLDGIVDTVAPVADPQTAACSVRVLIVDPPTSIKPGMFTRITIFAGPPLKGVAVPESALVAGPGEAVSVFVVSGQTLENRQVSTGETLDGSAGVALRLVLSGLSAGEVVVDEPDPGLKEGEHVLVYE
ncbi:MAG: efflux RND transporter periplasmic adaptor subunit, partial [Spirochaetales bacterium]|nr:efflux RND transporter periplasmic adaptor subunit [Spirochaetales bacterium]